jgi:formylglycine-generating enzyme required for sulfatase activity
MSRIKRKLIISIFCWFLSLFFLILASSYADEKQSIGDVWKDPHLGMEMVWVPGGCYQMGCGDWTSRWWEDELPVHEVCVDGFWMGKLEVTFGQYDRFCEETAREKPVDVEGWGRGLQPATSVTWNDAVAFAKWLSGKTGKHFRLPTEAEWEYACRSGGKPEMYAGGSDIDRLAWYRQNSDLRPHPVGTKEPNGLGLYDMSGNVNEWCEDLFSPDAYKVHSRNNPKYSSSGDERVLKRGSFLDPSRYVRCSARYHGRPATWGFATGFRLVRTK